ncbi:MAG: lipoprotein-releasing ABC transporter permease subunit [Neisseriaceae bacterium]|nr:MAG: lipoprotein-releasing ABC transporter permease subunit [Neisseriaceae bacterium]
MFSKFEIFIGLRYLKAKQKNSFVSFISLISIIGIALGVAALIIVLSVMNGFQREIRNKIIGVTSHMQIMSASNSIGDWQSIGDLAKTNKHVLAYAPYIDGQGLLSFSGNVTGVLVRGVAPSLEKSVDDIVNSTTQGSFNSLDESGFNIAIGQNLARMIGAGIGDKITIITPDGQITPAGMVPRIKQFTVRAIFNTHMQEYDSSLVFIGLKQAQILFKVPNSVSGIRLKVDDVMQTQIIKKQLYTNMPDDIIIKDWIDQHQNYFSAVAMEKKMMFVILSLIIAVAAFNLVSTLVMTVNDKKSDIAILRTIGASERNIMKIFMLQGGISGIIGTISGTILGVILAYFIGDIVHGIELITHTKLIAGDVYLIDYLPSQIEFNDVASIFVISILLSIIATIYPSRSAAKTNPAEALRYE